MMVYLFSFWCYAARSVFSRRPITLRCICVAYSPSGASTMEILLGVAGGLRQLPSMRASTRSVGLDGVAYISTQVFRPTVRNAGFLADCATLSLFGVHARFQRFAGRLLD